MRRIALLAVALLAPPLAGQAAPAAQPLAGHAAPAAAQSHPLGPDEAAWIDDAQVITIGELERYLATTFARKPPGQDALQQVLQEAIVEREAARAGFTASSGEVDAALATLDAQMKSAGGLAGALTADVDAAGLRNVMRLHVLQERLVREARHMLPMEPVTTEQLQQWIDARVAEAALQEAPLDDPRAATWSGGEITKQTVGARLRAVLGKDQLAGVLTEMIGVQLVRRRADELGLDLTPAEVTREILQRDTALKAHADSGLKVNYRQYLEQVEHRSLQEEIQSDAFTTEVLVRLITERQWTEDQARDFWEKNEPAYKARGLQGTWEQLRNAVWKDIRGAVYKDLFTKSRIVRRY